MSVCGGKKSNYDSQSNGERNEIMFDNQTFIAIEFVNVFYDLVLRGESKNHNGK